MSMRLRRNVICRSEEVIEVEHEVAEERDLPEQGGFQILGKEVAGVLGIEHACDSITFVYIISFFFSSIAMN